MKYNFDEIIDKAGTDSVQFSRLSKDTPEGVLPLWIADMDFSCPEPVLAAIHKRIDRKILGYTINNSERIINAVCSWHKRRHGWDIDKSWLFICPGIITAFSLLLTDLTEEGDGVIIQRPVYYPFTAKIEANRRVVVNNALIRQGTRYVMDYEDLEKKFADPRNKGMIFCSPHNPVGRVWKEDELLKLVGIAKKYNKWIISDEIHSDLARPGYKHIPLLKAAPEYSENIIVCTAPSKTFNTAGLLISNIIIPNSAYREKIRDITCHMTGIAENTNPLCLEAAVAAYTEGDEWLDQAIEYIDGNIRYADEFLKKNLPKAVMTDCEGTYLVWVDLRAYCADPEELKNKLVRDGKVLVYQGINFGEEGSGFVRINLATPRRNVAECMERIKKALLK